ncbi:MAG: restriction endonuclease [Proteobacteria bacterium]|nr:restriction endonuclease [Pseudomonadota bacterium]
MPIPNYQEIMLPLLKFAADGAVHHSREVRDTLADHFGLTPEERKQLLPSGKQATFDNRVGWARTYMTKAGLLTTPRRSYLQIAERGRQVLAENPAAINVSYLERFPEFLAFRTLRRDKSEADVEEPPITFGESSPEEALERAYQSLRSNLGAEILETVKGCSPAFFEELVVDLLVKMGYGGSRREAGQAIGRSGDEGIDGIIKEDRLGLDIIYIQAKRWSGVVGRPEIQKFAGALQGQRARKGIFITTSSFTREAYDFVNAIETKIILIDGTALTEYMIDNNVGVTTEASFEVKRIDGDYFTED